MADRDDPYDVGETVTLEASFALEGTPITPTGPTGHLEPPGQVAHVPVPAWTVVGTGQLEADVIPDRPGVWWAQVEGTIAGKIAIGRQHFTVT